MSSWPPIPANVIVRILGRLSVTMKRTRIEDKVRSVGRRLAGNGQERHQTRDETVVRTSLPTCYWHSSVTCGRYARGPAGSRRL